MATTTDRRVTESPSGIRPGGGRPGAAASAPASAPDPMLRPGDVVEVVFGANPHRRGGRRSPWRWRATGRGGRRLDKAILSNDDRIRPGVPCRVVVTTVRKPSVPGRGFYAVRYRGEAELRLPEHVWVPDVTRLRMGLLLSRGRNLLLKGPQGCGKNVITEAIADAMGYRYVYANASSAIEGADFVARLELRRTDGGGVETVWVPTPLLESLERALGDPAARELVFIDELNRCREQARNGLMSALDATRAIYDPTTGRFRPIPSTVQFVAAVNVGTQFTGTTPIDAATLDRFAPVRLDYPPADVERDLVLRAVPEATRSLAAMVIRVARGIRAERDILGGVSVRATIDATETLAEPALRALGRRAVVQVLREAFCERLEGAWDDPASDAGRASAIVERLVKGRAQADEADEPGPGPGDGTGAA